MRTTKLLIGGVLIALALLSCSSCGRSKSEASGIGVTAKTEVVDVTINSAYVSHGDEYAQPKQGNVFLALDISVVNVSSEEIAVESLEMVGKSVGFSILDDSGNEYYETIYVPEGQERFEGRTLSPKEKLAGYIFFEIPTTWESLKLQVRQWEMLKGEKIIGRIELSRSDIRNPEALFSPSSEDIHVTKTYVVAGKDGEYQVVAWVENKSGLVAGVERSTISLYGSDGEVLGSKTMEHADVLNRIFPSSGRWVISDVFENIAAQPARAELRLHDVWWQDLPSEPPSFNLLQAVFVPGRNPDYPEYEAKVVGRFSYSGKTLKRVLLVVILLGDDEEPVGTAYAEAYDINAGEHPFEADFFDYRAIYPRKPVASVEASFVTP